MVKKNDKDETGNVLLNLICSYMSITGKTKGGYSGHVMNKNKINMMVCNETKRNIAYEDDLIIN
jgi:hypothetical protein